MDVLILDCGDSIKGESILSDYTSKIEALSYSHSVAQQITGDQSNTKRTSGKPNHSDFSITKYLDLASPDLINACNSATVLPTVKLTIGQNESGKVNPYMVYTLTNALISAVSIGGGGGSKPTETVTFNYTAISWDYKVQSSAMSDGGVAPAKWNLATNSTS